MRRPKPAVEQTWVVVPLKHPFDRGRDAVDGIVVADERGRPSVCDDVVRTDSGVYPPSRDQAHLIAAAPELYRALAELLEAVAPPEACPNAWTPKERDKAIADARAALAKARGEKP